MVRPSASMNCVSPLSLACRQHESCGHTKSSRLRGILLYHFRAIRIARSLSHERSRKRHLVVVMPSEQLTPHLVTSKEEGENHCLMTQEDTNTDVINRTSLHLLEGWP